MIGEIKPAIACSGWVWLRLVGVAWEVAEPVFGLKIRRGMESGGDTREIKGKKGDLDIAVSMERTSPTTTKTEVTARKNLAEWDKDYAQRILDKIVKSRAS